jgi:mono/diheme cytochrome c family protein
MLKKKPGNRTNHKNRKIIIFVLIILFLFVAAALYFQHQNINRANDEAVLHQMNNPAKDVDVLAEGEGLELVKIHCTSCHSAKLIVQNRATREGWRSMIRWMQQTQNLWDLGENEEKILDYLSTHYPPEEKGRRENLKDIEWYDLE